MRPLEDHRARLMVCFRCIRVTPASDPSPRYKYPSYWIVHRSNDTDSLIDSLRENYDFIPVTHFEAISRFLKKMEKNVDETDDAMIAELYLH